MLQSMGSQSLTRLSNRTELRPIVLIPTSQSESQTQKVREGIKWEMRLLIMWVTFPLWPEEVHLGGVEGGGTT